MKLYLVAAYFFFWCQVSYIFLLFCVPEQWNHFLSAIALLSHSLRLCVSARARIVRTSSSSTLVSDHCHHFAYSFSRSINTIVMFVDNEMRVWISIWYTTSSAYWIFNCVTLLREAALPLHSISCLLSLSLSIPSRTLSHTPEEIIKYFVLFSTIVSNTVFSLSFSSNSICELLTFR